MRPRLHLLVAFVVLASAVGLGAAASAEECAPPQPAPLRFKPPVFVDQHRSGGEPVTVIAKDGSIVYSAHLGTTLLALRNAPEVGWYADYKNQTPIWRSTDGGVNWRRVELLPGVQMHSATSTGFSDPDFAIDSAGNLYGTEIDLANVSVFASHDNGQTWPDANPVATYGDRPWLTARGPDEVYLRVTGQLQKSTDGGMTWTELTDPNGYGDLFVDPTDPQGLLMGSSSGVGVEVSRDDGRTWTSHRIPGQSNRSAMMSIGVDDEGWAYYGWAQSSPSTNKEMRFAAWNPATKAWSTPIAIPKVGDGTPMWPWTVAGDAGRVAVGWYEYVPVPGQSGVNSLRVMVAVTENARGVDVTCPDGSDRHFGPQWSVADAAGRPVHVGAVPCRGTGCNATSDRRLGDFFTINFDAEGRVFVATGDTTLNDALDNQYQVSRPLFVAADDASPRLLAPSQDAGAVAR